ncbi:MAG: hypothetical protein H6579_02965 [Chitinophagales bacterium]|nr:hypothetical protein [Chitinophagales bacterium]
MRKSIRSILLLLLVIFIENSSVLPNPILVSSIVESTRYNNVLICISSTASKYHAYQCWGLDKCTHDIQTVSLSVAQSKGYSACRICYK